MQSQEYTSIMTTRLAKYCLFTAAFSVGLTGVLITEIFRITEPIDMEYVSDVAIPIPDSSAPGLPELFDVSPNDPLYQLSPDGVYFPVKDKGFEKDTALVMNFYGFNGGSIKIKEDFIDSELFLTKDSVRLQTKKTRGIQYVFEGRFLKDGFKERFEDGETVLSGTLVKYRAGKKMYAVSSKYVFASEVCAWNPNNQ